MGLDAYMFSYKGRNKKEVDFSHDQKTNEEIHYWRKHPNLEQWMSDLYFKKGGKGTYGMGGKSFNCNKVQLTKGDLLDLKYVTDKNALPIGGGFFHGDPQGANEYYREETLEAIDRALEAIENKRKVYYTSWW